MYEEIATLHLQPACPLHYRWTPMLAFQSDEVLETVSIEIAAPGQAGRFTLLAQCQQRPVGYPFSKAFDNLERLCLWCISRLPGVCQLMRCNRLEQCLG